MFEQAFYATRFGSHLFGPALPNSDIDYRGLFLPPLKGLVLGQGLQIQTGPAPHDIVLYSVQRFFKLLVQSADTNMVSLLFSYTHPTLERYGNTLFLASLDHRRLLSRKLGGMSQYVQSQAQKYSQKGAKLAALEVLLSLAQQHPHTLLDEAMTQAVQAVHQAVPESQPFVQLERLQGVGYLRVNDKLLIGRQTWAFHLPVLRNMQQSYGQRAKQAQLSHLDLKALYHAFRVLEELRQLHRYAHIAYPLNITPFLLQVRQGHLAAAHLFELLDQQVQEVNALQAQSQLPHQADWDYAAGLIQGLYGL